MSNQSRSDYAFTRWMRGCPYPRYEPRDKDRSTDYLIGYMLNRTQSIFRYLNLPETIPRRCLELYLQVNGSCAIAEVGGKLYALTGGLGGEPDPYYMPTIYTVANPALNLSREYRIGEDCVVIPSDSLYMGLIPLCSRYASMLTESELSLYVALINSRLVDLITAGTDRTKAAADKILADVESGKLAVVLDKGLEGTMQAFPYSGVNSRTMTEIIETIQYNKASWFNELGLNANWNAKRESLNSGETQLNNDSLLPLIDDMLRCRRDALEQVNAMFGTDIRVELFSSWEDNEIEIRLEQEELAAEPEISGQPETEVENNEPQTVDE